jgi:hypothetical protein
MGRWTVLTGPGSGTTPEVVGAPTSVALSPLPGGWASNPRYRVGDDGVSQYVDVSIRITPANDIHVAGFDIVIDKATGVLTPITGFYPYTNLVPATQDFVVTAERPLITQTWVYVVATRGDNGAFDPPDESIAATKVSVSVTGYSPGTGASGGVTGFTVTIVNDATSPVPQFHFKYTFTPPASDPNFYGLRIEMIFCDDPATHGGSYVPSAGATYFLVADPVTVSPAEEIGWHVRGSVGSWVLAKATPVNKLDIPNAAGAVTYGFALTAAGGGPLPGNGPASAVSGFSVVIVSDSASPVQQAHFKFLFTAPADPNWAGLRIEMIQCDNPSLHGGSYVPASGAAYFLVVESATVSPAEQSGWWPRGSLQGWFIARAIPLNQLWQQNVAAAVTYNFTITPATGGRIPDNNPPGAVTGFTVTIIDDPNSPTPQFHFKYTFTPPVSDPNFVGLRVEMIFCDDPATHGGSYVPSAGAVYFLVADPVLTSPAEETGWHVRGSLGSWVLAKATPVNALDQPNYSASVTFGFALTASTGARLNQADLSTVGAGIKVASSKLQLDAGNGITFSGNSATLNLSSPLGLSGSQATVMLGTIQSTHLAAGSLGDLSKYASDKRPVVVVSSNPGLPNASYPVGAIIFNTGDGKLYRNVANVWSKGTDPQDLIAGTIAAGVAYLGTVTAGQVTAGAFNGITLVLNLNGITTTINNATSGLGPAGLQVAINGSNQKGQLTAQALQFLNTVAASSVLLYDSGGTGGSLLLYPPGGASTSLALIAGNGSGATFDMYGSSSYIHLNNGGNITVFSGGYIDAYGGFRVGGTTRINANGGLMPRQPGNFASLAALSTSLGATWLPGEMFEYFDTTLLKQCLAFKDNLSGLHRWVES